MCGAECCENFKNWFRKRQKIMDKICCFLSEVLATGILVFLGCMGCVNTEMFPNSHFQLCLNFGIVVMVAIQCFGCVSGAHINPSVTVVALIYDMISLHMAAVYILGQLFGAFIGYGLLKLLLPADTINVGHGLCVTIPHENISTLQAVGIEFAITCILAWVCCGVWDPRNSKFHDSVSIRFGLAIFCLACTAGPFTGASMNPARSFGPALWHMNFQDHWIYWVSPLSASVISAYLYKYVFRRQVITAEKDEP